MNSRRWILGVLLVALGAGGGYYYYTTNEAAPEQARPEGGRGFGKKGDGANRVTPVAAQPAKKGEVKVYLTSLGTVTPVRTVTVRSRVDGQIKIGRAHV